MSSLTEQLFLNNHMAHRGAQLSPAYCTKVLGKVGIVSDRPEKFTRWVSILRCLGKNRDLSAGKHLHACIGRDGFDRDTFLGNCLVEMYGNCGAIQDARSAFDNIPYPDFCSWNVLIKAYGQNGRMNDAHGMFGQMPHRDVISWTAMMSMSSQNGLYQEALDLFHKMQVEGVKPNKITYVCALDACAELLACDEGEAIHDAIVDAGFEQDVVIGTALVKLYGMCGSLCKAWSVFSRLTHIDVVAWNAMIAAFARNGDFENATKLFDSMSQRDVASWNTMIAASIYNGHGKEALGLFHHMHLDGMEPNEITCFCALDACASLASLEHGQVIHAVIIDLGFERELVVGNALIDMYGKCGSLCDARRVFGRMPCLNVVSWTAMIVACDHNGHSKEALDLFHQMQHGGIKIDKVAFICVLEVCANLVAVEEGQKIHLGIVHVGLEEDSMVGTAIVNMYGKCGNLQEARYAFARLPSGNSASWNAMIAALAHNGHAREAIYLFHRMQIESIKADSVTFICLLTACSHMGWVDDGKYFFVSMVKNHGVTHTDDHCVCMIDLLGRAGHLDKAEDLINNISFEEVVLAWLSLLNACRIHGDVERAVRAANYCFELDPMDIVPYVMLSNVLAIAGRWDGVAKIPYLSGIPIMSVQKGCVYIETYGCQMNVNDLEVVLAIMKNAGYSEIVDKAEDADVILINTCAIRDNAEHKVWHRLNYFKHLKSKWNRNVVPTCSRSDTPPKVAVLGCMAERLKEKLVEANKMVDVVCGPDAYRDLPRLLATVDEGCTAVNTLLSLEETYACIVPFTRGRERSRPADSILNDVKQLWEQGVKEVMLLGQNVNLYNDVSGRTSTEEVLRLGGRVRHWHVSSGFSSVCRSKEDGLCFSDLLDLLSAQFPEMRFRFTSPHPKDFPDELLFLIRERMNVCKNIHLPAQSGSTRILEKMRRGYSREAYLSLVERIRSILPDSSLSSDFIAGFCGETEEDHSDTLSLIEKVGYDMAYMFAYSLREKTHAHRNYEDDVPEPVKQRRLSELINMFRQTTIPRFESQIGTVQLVLVTGSNKRDPTEWIGRSDKGHKVVFANRSLPHAISSASLLPAKMNMLEDASFIVSNEGMDKQCVKNQQFGKLSCGSDRTCKSNLGIADCMEPKPGDYVEVLIMETSAASLRGYPLVRTDLKTFFSKTVKNNS